MENESAKNEAAECFGGAGLTHSDVSWRRAPEEKSLGSSEIHVWRIDLDHAKGRFDKLACLLSEDERARASRLRFDPVRERWILGRALLREVLSSYTALEPAEITFAYGAHGKPALCNPSIHFNYSHSDRLALCAVSRHEPVGVDIEKVRFMAEAVSIAKRCFSPEEQSEFFDAPIGEKQRTFYSIWTRKEACAKWSGRGLGQLEEELGRPNAFRGYLLGFSPAESFVGCLAVARAPGKLQFWQWDGMQGSI